MKLIANRFRVAAAMAVLAAALASPAARADYPDRPVNIIVPYGAGGPTDISARIVAQELSTRLKQPFVVVNRAGAGGNVGAESVARAAPDGYNLLVIGAAHTINKSLYPSLTYDLTKDFVPIALFTTAPLVLLAHPSFPANTVKELVALAKAKPGSISYSSQGNGTAPHLTMELLKSKTGTRMVHIPYRGSALSLNDMVANVVPLGFDSVVVGQQFAGTGKLKAIAVTGPQRSRVMPDVPTMAEAGFPQIDALVWYGLAAPTGTPADMVQLLNQTIREILRNPEVIKRLLPLGVEVAQTSQQEFANFMQAEMVKWAEVVKASGAKVD